MKKILVPCDFSYHSVEAFKFALEVARQSDGEIILLHVVALQPMFDSMLLSTVYFEETFLGSMKTEAENCLEHEWPERTQSHDEWEYCGKDSQSFRLPDLDLC